MSSEYLCLQNLLLLLLIWFILQGGRAPEADGMQHLRDDVPAGAEDLLPVPGLVLPLHPRLRPRILHPPPH
jgi:hypothetical protein